MYYFDIVRCVGVETQNEIGCVRAAKEVCLLFFAIINVVCDMDLRGKK